MLLSKNEESVYEAICVFGSDAHVPDLMKITDLDETSVSPIPIKLIEKGLVIEGTPKMGLKGKLRKTWVAVKYA